MEQRLGVAVPGVLCCFASALAVVAAYAQVDPTAGACGRSSTRPRSLLLVQATGAPAQAVLRRRKAESRRNSGCSPPCGAHLLTQMPLLHDVPAGRVIIAFCRLRAGTAARMAFHRKRPRHQHLGPERAAAVVPNEAAAAAVTTVVTTVVA